MQDYDDKALLSMSGAMLSCVLFPLFSDLELPFFSSAPFQVSMVLVHLIAS